MKGSNEEENKICASLVAKTLKRKVMGGHGVSFFREDLQVFWKTTIAMVIDAQISKNSNFQKGKYNGEMVVVQEGNISFFKTDKI